MMNDVKNMGVFGASVVVSYTLLIFSGKLGIYGLWGSLCVLVLAAIYFSYSFIMATDRFSKLYFYICLLPFIIMYFALVYKAFGIIDSTTNSAFKPDWLNAIYFSVVTWTTLGYGDYRPTEYMKPWVIIEALMGYIYMGLLVGKVVYFVTRTPAKVK